MLDDVGSVWPGLKVFVRVNKKIFYLSQLTHLGGHVVTFLSKRVDFIVTKAGKKRIRLLPSITPVTNQSRSVTMVIKSETKEVKRLSCVTEIARRWNTSMSLD